MSVVVERRIAHVYECSNGMCIVFDQFGKQMPEYQGRTEEMRPRIQEVFRGVVTHLDWNTRDEKRA